MQHRPKRYIQIAEQIRTSIISGDFQPGTKLPSERELAQRYDVGRSSVREALTILQGMGLIEIRHGYGAQILAQGDQSSLSAGANSSDERELLVVRAALECQTAQLAAQRATKADLAQLADTLWAMEAELEQGQLASETELQFQLALASASHNRLLYLLTSTLIAHMRETLVPESQQVERDPVHQKRLLDQYRHIFRAIAAGDTQRAAVVMREHLDFLINELERRGAARTQNTLSVESLST